MTENPAKSTKYPALVLCVLAALAARGISRLPFAPFTVGEHGEHPIDPLFMAVILGLLLRNLVPATLPYKSEISAWSKRLLPVAIALMGARLDIQELLAVSGPSLMLSAVCVALGLGITLGIGKLMGLSTRFAALLGAGTAICGSTAIAILAPVIRARSEETALSITTVTALGTVAIVALPPIGHALEMSQSAFGLWAGLAVHATPQVVATGFAYGAQAGEIALVVKLIRILLLIPLVIMAQIFLGQEQSQAGLSRRAKVKKLFPPFILGFLIFVAANSLGYLSVELIEGWSLSQIMVKTSGWLFAIAMVGVGYGVDAKSSLKIGPRPFAVGTLAFVVLAGLSLFAVMTWGA